LNVLVVPGERLPIEQVVVELGEPQFHDGPEVWRNDTKVIATFPGTLLGKLSVKLAFVAVLLPKFVIVMT
jgi:hypothetical protein